MKEHTDDRKNRKKRVSSSPHTTGWLFFLVVIVASITIFKGIGWMREMRVLNDRKDAIERKIDKEKYRTQQLLEYKDYMKTDEYIEDIAGNELGMVYEGEVIFKEDN